MVCVADTCVFVSEEVMLAEEDKHAEEKSPLDGAWYKRKHNNPGQEYNQGPELVKSDHLI
jgi:hypothetical protein